MDYTPVVGTLVISDATVGDVECAFIPTIDDDINEFQECFNTMIAPVGVQPDLTILLSSSQICIVDNDGKPTTGPL